MSRSSIITMIIAVAVFALIAGGIKWKQHLDHERRVDGWMRVIENDPGMFGYDD